MAYERMLLMGGPGTGKTQQIVNVCAWLAEKKKEMWVLDLEDKVEAFLSGQGGIPKNMHLKVALTWEETREVIDNWKTVIKKDNWIAVDRVDLAWPRVQNFYSQQKYKQDMADRLLKTAVALSKPSMFTPRFDQGDWQPINEQYDYFITNVLYLFRCNVLLTSGITNPRDDASPFEMFSNVGVAPRGQKELAHQPNTVFLLSDIVERDHSREVINRSWYYTTAKDLPGREYKDKELLIDLAIQYLEPLEG